MTLVPAEVWTASLAEAQSIAVTTVALFQACYLLHCRSLHGGLGAVGWFSNEDTCPPSGRFSYLGRVDCQFFDKPFNRASNLALVMAYSSKRR
jgi:hypothetical protein